MTAVKNKYRDGFSNEGLTSYAVFLLKAELDMMCLEQALSRLTFSCYVRYVYLQPYLSINIIDILELS